MELLQRLTYTTPLSNLLDASHLLTFSMGSIQRSEMIDTHHHIFDSMSERDVFLLDL